MDLEHRCVHVHRSPGPAGYASVVQFGADARIAPSAFADVGLDVASVLPPR